jgi:hypothetical protein
MWFLEESAWHNHKAVFLTYFEHKASTFRLQKRTDRFLSFESSRLARAFSSPVL